MRNILSTQSRLTCKTLLSYLTYTHVQIFISIDYEVLLIIGTDLI